MFFKNALVGVYPEDTDLSGLAAALEQDQFTPCTSLQVQSTGWVPVEEELVYAAGVYRFLRFAIEKRGVPSTARDDLLAVRIAELAEKQGFMPGKKAVKELKEQVVDELLPRALPTRRIINVMIDTTRRRVIIDTSSAATSELILKSLFKHAALEVNTAPGLGRLLNELVLGQDDPAFTVDDEFSLQLAGNKKTLVRYQAAGDDTTSEAQRHIAGGATVTSVALTYDAKVSFVLQSTGALRSIKPTDLMKEHAKDAKEFEATCLLGGQLLSDLLDEIYQAARDAAPAEEAA
mgnify:CR=1 FL=1